MVILARCMVEDNCCELEASLGYGETMSHPKKKQTNKKNQVALFFLTSLWAEF